jgi:hypothetical protein
LAAKLRRNPHQGGENTSKVFDEIDKVPTQTLASDLPETITATVLAATRSEKKGQFAGAPLLKLELQTDDGKTFSTQYRIPKSWTGKGQMDQLLKCLENIGVDLHAIIGKTFVWKRMELPGSVKGNERFYPIKVVKTPKP